jgi:hypothetical protein
MDLAQIDAEAAARNERRGSASTSEAPARVSKRPHGRRHRASRQAGRANSSDFNRRLQLALFVTLLLVGIVVVMRACSGGARSAETDAAPLGQVEQVRPCPPHQS